MLHYPFLKLEISHHPFSAVLDYILCIITMGTYLLASD